jgi:hypothetical protein
MVGRCFEDVYRTCNVRRRLLHSRCYMLLARHSPDIHELRYPGQAPQRDLRLDARQLERRHVAFLAVPFARSRPRPSRSSRYSRWLAPQSRPRPRCTRTASSASTPETPSNSGSLSERFDERTHQYAAALGDLLVNFATRATPRLRPGLRARRAADVLFRANATSWCGANVHDTRVGVCSRRTYGSRDLYWCAHLCTYPTVRRVE